VRRVAAQVEVANYVDVINARRGLLEPTQVRRLTLRGVIHAGATRLTLPERVVRQLGLPSRGKIRVRYANRAMVTRDAVPDVHVRLLGRDGVFTAIAEPKRRTALIGAIVLTDLDIVMDRTGRQLAPRNRRYVITEIE